MDLRVYEVGDVVYLTNPEDHDKYLITARLGILNGEFYQAIDSNGNGTTLWSNDVEGKLDHISLEEIFKKLGRS